MGGYSINIDIPRLYLVGKKVSDSTSSVPLEITLFVCLPTNFFSSKKWDSNSV